MNKFAEKYINLPMDIDLKNSLDTAREEGKAEGKAEGIEEGLEMGITEGIKRVALNALKMGKTIEETAELTGLMVGEVEGMKE